MIRLSPLRPRDVAPLAEMTARIELLRRYGWNPKSARKILRKALADRASDLVIAKDASGILGFAWIVRRGGFARIAYLRLIAVDPKQARSGVGRKLMKEMERRHRKPYGLILLATSTNTAAKRFYTTLGYRRVGLIRDCVRKGIDEVIYFKPPAGNSRPSRRR